MKTDANKPLKSAGTGLFAVDILIRDAFIFLLCGNSKPFLFSENYKFLLLRRNYNILNAFYAFEASVVNFYTLDTLGVRRTTL